MPNEPRRVQLAPGGFGRDTAVGALDVVITAALTGTALLTHTVLLLLPAAGWACLALRQFRLARRAAAAAPRQDL